VDGAAGRIQNPEFRIQEDSGVLLIPRRPPF
jgi:hypothetical protein